METNLINYNDGALSLQVAASDKSIVLGSALGYKTETYKVACEQTNSPAVAASFDVTVDYIDPCLTLEITQNFVNSDLIQLSSSELSATVDQNSAGLEIQFTKFGE